MNRLILSLFILISFTQAQDKKPVKLRAEIIITGEIVADACSPNIINSKHLSTQQIAHLLSDNCTISGPTSHAVPKARITAFSPSIKDQTQESSKALSKYSFFISEYL